MRTKLSRIKTYIKYYVVSSLKRLSFRKKKRFTYKTVFILTSGLFLGLFLIWFFLLRGGGASAAWYNDGWGYRQKFVIDNTKVSGSTDMENFPVLISVTSDTNLAAQANADGSDFVFTDSAGAKLDHEIEYYSNGTLAAWVRIPTLSTSIDTTIYMYYGNPAATSQQNAAGVWPSHYRGVWHLAETSGQHLDSTSNNNDSSAVNVTTQGSATGKIGGASDFASGNEVIIPDSNSLDISGSFTAQAWVKADTISGSGSWNSIIYKGGNSNYFLELTNSDEIDAGFYGGGGWRGTTTTNSPVSTGTFYHLAVVHDAAADTIKIYVDGVEKGSVSGVTQTPLVNTSTFTIGENFYNETFDGIIDEVRLSDTPKSVDWLLTEYNNQNSPSTFYTQGHQEIRKRGPSGYWKFDEGYGTNVNDASGNGKTGTMGAGTSAPTWRDESMCVSGSCLEFDGNNDYLSFGDNFDVEDGKDFTVSAWMRTNSFSTIQTLVSKKTGTGAGQGGYMINIGTSGTLNFYAADGTDQIWRGNSFNLSTNTWYHVTFVYDDDNASNTIFYINGSPSSGNMTGTLANVNSMANAQPFAVGSEPDRQYVFNGFIDEVKFYPYVRTADEIKQDYLFSSTKGASVVLGAHDKSFMSEGLIGYWKMDETTGTTGPSWTAIDSSGNGNDVTGGGNVSQTTGKFGNAAKFDGSVDYLEGNAITSTFDPTTGSMCAWSLADSDSAESTVVSFTSSTGGNQGVYIENDFGTWNMGYDNGTDNQINSSFDFNINTWTHLCLVWNGDKLYGYQDGKLKDTITIEDGAISVTIDYFNIGILQNDFIYINDYSGKIDEVRIYNRPLSQNEIKSLYEWSAGPIGYWKLDEGTGTTVQDSSGIGTTGVFNNDPTWTVGKYGKGVNFDGTSSQRIDMDIPPKLEMGIRDWTMSLWVKLSTTNSGSLFSLIDKGGTATTTEGYWLYHDSTNVVKFRLSDGATRLTATGTSTISDNAWHYITVTLARNGNATLYVDGVVDGTGDFSSFNGTDITNSSREFRVGGQLYGVFDDIKVYDYVRTQDQIIQDMNAGHPAVGTPVGSTVLHTKFDEGYGSTVNDSSSLENNGTLGTGTSSPTWSNDGKFGKALSFDGNDYVDFGDNDELKLTFPFTISAWVNINELPADEYTIISKWYSFTNDREYAFQIAGDNRLRFGFSSNGSDSEFVYADTAFSSADFDQWIHVMLTADENRNYTFYRNGVPDGSGTFSLTSIANDTASAMIGAVHYSNALPSRFFKGKIDEVKLYPFDLNSEQVKTEFNGGKMLVLGAKSTGVGGTTPSNAANRAYCVPGDTAYCDAPVGEWKLNEKTGTVAYDTSGNNFNGTLTNSPTWTTGKFGSGINTDGADQHINITDPPGGELDFNSTDNGTFMAWVRSTTASSDTFLYKGFGGGDPGYRIRVASDGDAVCGIGDNAPDTTEVTANNSAIVDGEWHHVACVIGGSGTTLSIYVDGLFQGTVSDAEGSLESAKDLNIGSNSGSSYWPGDIDEVRIYKYARTPAQIAWDYNRGAPVAHYKFDECQGSTAYNSALNGDGKAAGNDGTITIGATGTASVGNCSTSSTAWGNGASGKINSALDLDGTDDYVSISDSSSISFGDGSTDKPFSITAWIKMDDATDFQFISKVPASGVLSNLEWALGVGATDRLGVRLYDNSALAYIGKYTNATLTAYEGQWIHVTMTYDGSESGNGIGLYINGQEIAGTSESAGSYAGMENTSSDLRIGAIFPSDATYKKFANGQVDDIRIFNYKLTAEQIGIIMNNSAVRFE